MALYDFRSILETIPAGADRTRVLRGNSRRVTIIFSSRTIANLDVADSGGSSLDSVIIQFDFPGIRIMAFRDFGPAIQGEIWVAHQQVGARDLSITELLLLRHC